MLEFIYSFIIPATLTILSGVMGYVVWLMQQQRTEQREAAKASRDRADLAEKEMRALKEGIKLILRKQLFDYHEKICVRGEGMSADDFDEIKDIYDAYTTLGGNGTGKKAFEEIKEVHLS